LARAKSERAFRASDLDVTGAGFVAATGDAGSGAVFGVGNWRGGAGAAAGSGTTAGPSLVEASSAGAGRVGETRGVARAPRDFARLCGADIGAGTSAVLSDVFT
jgi:hypothetical protein